MRLSLLLALLLLSLSCSKKTGSGNTSGSTVSQFADVGAAGMELHSAFEDPDASLIEGQDFEDIPTSVGAPILDTTVEDPDTVAETDVEEAQAIPEHLQIALSFADDPHTEEIEGGVIEDPNNRSPDIDQWLSALLAEPFKPDGTGAPYCAAFASFCLSEAGNVTSPRTRSAAARHFVDDKQEFRADMCAASLSLGHDDCTEEVPARVVIRGVAPVLPGTMVIWKRKRNPDNTLGHIGFVREWEGVKGKTVEGNTSSGVAGNQADGGGVYLRERMLSAGSWFRITHFRPVVLN